MVGALAVAAALNACGGGAERAGPVQPVTPSSTSSAGDDATTTTARAATSTTKKPTRPLPGPVSPSTPLAGKVSRWHADLTAMTTASCTRIVTETTSSTGETDLDDALILLYRGAGEGCLGRTTQARAHLGQARTALAGLSSDELDNASPRCRPQELLSWAFFTYLDTDVPATCPSPTPSTTRTTRATTTTRRP